MVLLQIAASHCHYYFDPFTLGRPRGKWRFISVFIFMWRIWQLPSSFTAYGTSTVLPLWTILMRFERAIETQKDIHSVYSSSLMFYFSVTSMWQRFSAEFCRGKLEKLFIPLSEQSNSWKLELYKLIYYLFIYFLTRRTGAYGDDVHCSCRLYLNIKLWKKLHNEL